MSERRKPEAGERTWKIRPSTPDPVEARSQKRELLAEQQADWAADCPAPPEHYLERWPTDPKDDTDAASLLVAEICQRRDRREQPRVDDFEERFPEHGRAARGALVRHQDLIHSLGGGRRHPITCCGSPRRERNSSAFASAGRWAAEPSPRSTLRSSRTWPAGWWS